MMTKRFMLQIVTDTCKRQMFTNSFESATHAYDRIMKVARLTKLPEKFIVSVSATSGSCFTHHYAEAYRGMWLADKKNWDYEDWFNF